MIATASAILVSLPDQSRGANITSKAAGGNWHTNATWVGNKVPVEGDNVTIANGATVTIDNPGHANNVTIGSGSGATATLKWSSTTDVLLEATGSVTIATNGVFKCANTGVVSHWGLIVGGDLINNGVLDFCTNNGANTAAIRFTGAGNNIFSGTGPITDVSDVEVNKGNSTATGLVMNPVNFSIRDSTTGGPQTRFLTLKGGLLKISGTFTITTQFFGATPGVGAGAGLWFDNPNFTVEGYAGGNFPSNGYLRFSQGTLTVGAATGDYMNISGGVFIMESGTINVAGYLNADYFAAVTISGGTINVATVGNDTTSPSFSAYDNFTMTRGAINVVHANSGPSPYDYFVSPNASLTGGTVHFGPGTPTAAKFYASGAVYDLAIDNVNPNTSLVIKPGDFTILHDATIPSSATVDLRYGNLIIKSNTLTNNGSIVSTIDPNYPYSVPVGILSFVGETGQTNLGSGSANVPGLQIDNPGGLTLGSSLNGVTTTRLTFLRGGMVNANKLTIGNGGNVPCGIQYGQPWGTVTVGNFDVAPVFDLGTGGLSVVYEKEPIARTTSFEIPPTRQLANFTIRNVNGATLAGGDLTIGPAAAGGSQLVLNGNLVTNGNTVIIDPAATVAAADYGYVVGTLRKTFVNPGDSRTFEVGTANGYSPLDVTSGNGPATLTVYATSTQEPHSADPHRFKRYWTIAAPSNFSADLTFHFFSDETEAGPLYNRTYSVSRYNGSWTVFPTTMTDSSNRNPKVTGVSPLNGNWTLIEVDSDGDGIPDWYENLMGFNPNDPSDANADFDGDGMSNLAEYLSSTNPKDAKDVLRVTSAALNPSGFVISFPVVGNRTYRIEYKNSLDDAAWLSLSDYYAQYTGTGQVTDTSLAGRSQRFYRVRYLGPL